MFKKFKLWLYALPVLGGSIILSTASKVHAQTLGGFGSLFNYTSLSANTDLGVMITKAIQLFLLFAALMAFVYLVYSGYLYITAAGDPEKTETAKKSVINAIIGIIVIVIAYALITYIQAQIGNNAPA